MPLPLRNPPANSTESSVVSWMNQEPNMVRAQSFDGGWEGWAQVQLAMFLKQATTLASISREKKIYVAAPNERADLFVEPVDGSPNVGLELKCRLKAEVKTDFQDRFLQDLAKINLGLKQGAKPCLMYAMAITNLPGDLDGWDNFATKYTLLPAAYLQANGWYVIMWANVYK